MNITYKTITQKLTEMGNPSLRVIHVVIVEDETLTTTRQKEILKFVKDRNPDKYTWKRFKEAVRLNKPFQSSK